MIRKCVTCGTRFNTPPSVVKRGGGMYCSKSCKAKTQLNTPEKIAEQFIDGRSTYRRLAIETYGNQCMECGLVVFGKDLHVHHIEECTYDFSVNHHPVSGNHSVSNLMVLCKPCHKAIHGVVK